MKKKPKVLLIGWDSADWKVINPLLDSGQMPALESIVNNGVMGNIATLDPPLSPMLWTSIATGKYAFKHGVHGFLEGVENNTKLQPVTNASIKTKTIWKILNEHGIKTNVVGWWPSHPAEEIDGVQVSNFYGKLINKESEKWDLPPQTITPKKFYKPLRDCRVHPNEFSAEQLLPFIPSFQNATEEQRKKFNILLKDLAECLSIHSAATYLTENSEWDFMAVYYNAIDHISHVFMKYHPPKLDWVSTEDYEMYKEVINAFYKFHDMMLGRWLELVDEDTYVIVMSDHGFHSDHLRKKALPKEPAAIAREHNHFGMIAIKGPGIKKDERIYGASLLDVAPTLLSIYNLPIAQDMDGKVLAEMYENQPKLSSIASYDSEDESFDIKTLQQTDSEEMMQQLADLGYIDAPNANSSEAVQRTLDENNYYLARSYADAGKFEEAMLIMEKLSETYPKNHRYLIKQAQISLNTYNVQKLDATIEKLSAIFKTENVVLKMLQGKSAFLKNNYKEALQYFQSINEYESNDYIASQLGNIYLKMGKFNEAIASFNKNLALDKSNSNALFGLGITYLSLKDYEKAIGYLLDSISLVYHNAQAHYNLGTALFEIEAYTEAAQAFEVALKIAPKMLKARTTLIEIYTNYLVDEAKLNALQNTDEIEKETIYIVSGLPRSGTSMMMQMLEAGGLTPFTDNLRTADTSNPKGYYEHEAIKRLAVDTKVINRAKGKVVKVISSLLKFLPDRYNYKVIVMKRNVTEISISQEKMLLENNKLRAESAVFNLEQNLQNSYNEAIDFLKLKPNVDFLELNYNEILSHSEVYCKEISHFLSKNLDTKNMLKIIDKNLHRNKINM